eukprot:TRINITY_DN12282_c0_g1_i4.p1 TRINITY_DN12282_c0_g1~~TRINITY_DN12282_c0_g1_i4.p1  ORF type:complete len:308 (+),score=26.56 TRINITY_DN12282_c0_g1_i4:473-1396(+)
MITITAIGQNILRVTRYKAMLSYFKRRRVYSSNATLASTGHLKFLLIEIALNIPHPNIVTRDVNFTLFSPVLKRSYTQTLNEFLNLFQLHQIFIICRMILTLSYYFNQSAQRVMSMMGLQSNYLFVVKSLLKSKPFTFLGINLLIGVFMFSFALRICERRLTNPDDPLDMDFGNYWNCIWNIVITMSTIGFGDYYPRTIPGRVVIALTGMWGLIVFSLLVTTVMNFITMDPIESKVYTIIERLRSKRKMKNQSQRIIAEAFRMKALRRRGIEVKDKEVSDLHLSINEFKNTITNYRAMVHELSLIHI